MASAKAMLDLTSSYNDLVDRIETQVRVTTASHLEKHTKQVTRTTCPNCKASLPIDSNAETKGYCMCIYCKTLVNIFN